MRAAGGPDQRPAPAATAGPAPGAPRRAQDSTTRDRFLQEPHRGRAADGELFLLTPVTWEVPRKSPLPKSAHLKMARAHRGTEPSA